MQTSWWDRDLVRTSYGNVVALEPHRAVWNAGERLHSDQGESRRSRADAALFLYYGNRRRGLNGSRFVGDIFGEEPPFRNVVQMCADTLTAHIVRNKVRVLFQTSAGDTEAQWRARMMSKAVEAMFDDAGLYGHVGSLICQDGNLFDAGAAKVVVDYSNGRLLIERVFPWEIYVPEEEARLGAPRQMFHRTVADRRVLLSMFPDQEEAIKQAPSCPDDWRYSDVHLHSETSDLVAVWEAWHLPSGSVDLDDPRTLGKGEDGEFDPGVDPGHDGRHVIAIESATLSDRPWPFDYFPIALFRPRPDAVGYYSRSIPETLVGTQLELMKLGRRIQALIHLHAVPRLVVSKNAKINLQKASNEHASILEVTGSPSGAIYYLQPNAVPAALFQREAELVESAFQLLGISELSAFAQKPAGIDHAPGLQHLADTESVRHTPAFRAWEDFHRELARPLVDGCRLLAEHDPNFAVMFGDAKDLQSVKWSEVDLERSKYKIRRWPTNLLPSTPAAKASTIAQLTQQGVFTQPQAQTMMLDNPDIEALLGDTTAMQQNVDRKIERILREGYGEDTAPNPYMDLALCKTSAATQINRLEANGVPDEKVEGVRRFWKDAYELELRMQADAANAAQGIAPTPGGPPPGGGVPAPPPAEQAPPLAA